MPDRVDRRRAERPPHPRALAEMALDSTAAHADELARRWAVAMILARPIERMGELSLQEIAIEAPALCAQVIRALQSDVELDRLTGWGPPSGREHSAQALRFAT